jgi:hypothetical protein
MGKLLEVEMDLAETEELPQEPSPSLHLALEFAQGIAIFDCS